MSNDVPVDMDMDMDMCEQELGARFRLRAAEMWTDIFKLLPRRILVQQIQPVGKFFNNICNKHVKSVHMIKNAGKLLWKLELKGFANNKQLKALAGNKCELTGQFRMDFFHISPLIMGSKAQQVFFRHSLEFFEGCQIDIQGYNTYRFSAEMATEKRITCAQLDFLSFLGMTNPCFISFPIRTETQAQFLRNPTVCNCNWIEISESHQAWTNRQSIFDWLHHKPRAKDVELEPELRTLNFHCNPEEKFIDWLLRCCFQGFEQSRDQSDCLHFLLTFKCKPDPDHVEEISEDYENSQTGELLRLKRTICDVDDDGNVTCKCYLLRCMANQMTNELNATLLKTLDNPNYSEHERAKEPTRVFIFGSY